VKYRCGDALCICAACDIWRRRARHPLTLGRRVAGRGADLHLGAASPSVAALPSPSLPLRL